MCSLLSPLIEGRDKWKVPPWPPPSCACTRPCARLSTLPPGCVCMYVCMYGWMDGWMYMHACIHTCMHVCYMHACMHTCMHVHTHAHAHTHTQACMYACMDVCAHRCMYVCMYVRTYVCTYVWAQQQNTTEHKQNVFSNSRMCSLTSSRTQTECVLLPENIFSY